MLLGNTGYPFSTLASKWTYKFVKKQKKKEKRRSALPLSTAIMTVIFWECLDVHRGANTFVRNATVISDGS